MRQMQGNGPLSLLSVLYWEFHFKETAQCKFAGPYMKRHTDVVAFEIYTSLLISLYFYIWTYLSTHVATYQPSYHLLISIISMYPHLYLHISTSVYISVHVYMSPFSPYLSISV